MRMNVCVSVSVWTFSQVNDTPTKCGEMAKIFHAAGWKTKSSIEKRKWLNKNFTKENKWNFKWFSLFYRDFQVRHQKCQLAYFFFRDQFAKSHTDILYACIDRIDDGVFATHGVACTIYQSLFDMTFFSFLFASLQLFSSFAHSRINAESFNRRRQKQLI